MSDANGAVKPDTLTVLFKLAIWFVGLLVILLGAGLFAYQLVLWL